MTRPSGAKARTADASQSFPRQYARTRRFTLGHPRNFQVAEDGSRVAFLRSSSGTDPVNALWVFDVDAGTERLVADPRDLLGSEEGNAPAAELARRERIRETAGGIVSYAADFGLRVATFSVGGGLFGADLAAGFAWAPDAVSGVFDPRPDPTLAHVAYVAERALRVTGLRGGGDRLLVGEEDPDITWGMAEFIAAEEMGRTRGYWWAPDGRSIAAARVDTSRVQEWHIGDPSDPARFPATVPYPVAGTENADVSLFVLSIDGAGSASPQREIRWDREAFPYLVTVVWETSHPLTLVVQSRDQRTMQVLTADPDTGATNLVREDRDPAWLEIVPGVPRWTPDERLVWTVDRDDTRRLVFDDVAVTPVGLQVRRVVSVGDEGVVFAASEDPTELHLWSVTPNGELTRFTSEPGIHDGAARGNVLVVVSATLDRPIASVRVYRGGSDVGSILSNGDESVLRPHVTLARTSDRALRYAILLPEDPPEGPLPVLLDPYGGPHASRVLKAQSAFLQSQWFAEQGFAVVVADGRGTPGRGPAWERTVLGDLATPPLEDQIEALHAAAESYPGAFDLGRVAIRGWSFGGYLAALAVLRRPDVFHAAIAGAPVTDWHLYDTHYTERYLGQPDEQPEAYRRSSPIEDAVKLERPLLLIHGLADDNVVVANTLRLSAALLAAGRPHSFLPLSGVTHMTPQEVVTENLMLLQVAFLREALDLD